MKNIQLQKSRNVGKQREFRTVYATTLYDI